MERENKTAPPRRHLTFHMNMDSGKLKYAPEDISIRGGATYRQLYTSFMQKRNDCITYLKAKYPTMTVQLCIEWACKFEIRKKNDLNINSFLSSSGMYVKRPLRRMRPR